MSSSKKLLKPLPIEASYPVNFREEDSKVLGNHLRLRHNVELVGAKRVGISNFLRFFLYQREISEKYIGDKNAHLQVTVDLNDLIEVDLFAFWILTFKRLVDSVENADVSDEIKKEISEIFLDSIQSRNMFLTVEGLRKALVSLVSEGLLPTLFFLRFDRLSEVINKEIFSNFVGLREATAQKVAYVFTSFRALDQIAPEVFLRRHLTVFSHPMFIKPASKKDLKIVFETYEAKYHVSPPDLIENKLIELSAGHIQYLHLSLIIYNQKIKNGPVKSEDLLEMLGKDERIKLQSEEIWESLGEAERKVLAGIASGKKIEEDLKKEAKYIFYTGLVVEKEKGIEVFSPLLSSYVESKAGGKGENGKLDFTKKENLLYRFLLDNKGEVCEREAIIENVWSESEELGVSDWTIDRLVARVRTKLKKQNSKNEIVTVKTRGFKLV